MDRQGQPDIHRTEQGVLNNSFDEMYQVLAVEQLVHNPQTDNLDRMQQPGDATATKQDAQTALLELIKDNTEMMQALAVVVKNLQQAQVDPPYIDKSANAIRNQVQSGTITTVSTVTNTGDLNNVNTYQGKILMVGQDISAWALTVRGRIT